MGLAFVAKPLPDTEEIIIPVVAGMAQFQHARGRKKGVAVVIPRVPQFAIGARDDKAGEHGIQC